MNIHHYGIQVSNMEKSIKFYQSFLHLHVESTIHFMDEEIVFLTGKDIRIELIKGNGIKSRFLGHIAIQVENLSNFMLRINEKGYFPMEGPYQLFNGWRTVFYAGPDGEVIEFIQVSNDLENVSD